MGLVINVLDKDVETQINGKWFTFKPGKPKLMSEHMSQFVGTNRAEDGLAELPSKFEEDMDYINTPEGKQHLESISKEVHNKRKAHLQRVANNLASFQRDLDTANMKVDARRFAQGELAALEELAKYAEEDEQLEQRKADRVAELEAKIKRNRK